MHPSRCPAERRTYYTFTAEAYRAARREPNTAPQPEETADLSDESSTRAWTARQNPRSRSHRPTSQIGTYSGAVNWVVRTDAGTRGLPRRQGSPPLHQLLASFIALRQAVQSKPQKRHRVRTQHSDPGPPRKRKVSAEGAYAQRRQDIGGVGVGCQGRADVADGLADHGAHCAGPSRAWRPLWASVGNSICPYRGYSVMSTPSIRLRNPATSICSAVTLGHDSSSAESARLRPPSAGCCVSGLGDGRPPMRSGGTPLGSKLGRKGLCRTAAERLRPRKRGSRFPPSGMRLCQAWPC